MGLTLRAAPRVSRDHFIHILEQGTSAGVSPCAPIGGQCWDAIVATGLDPAILIAIFGKESQYGCTGYAPKTLNWGNVRHAFHTDWAVGQHPADVAIYPDWLTSLRDLCDRLNNWYIDLWGLPTVELAIPRYAPSVENDTAGYIKFVLDHVAAWQAQEAGTVVNSSIGFADETTLITLGDNRPGTKLTGFHSWVQHETANEDPGATARMHKKYWDVGGGGRFISSVPFVADMVESLQLMPIDEVAWHIGDGADDPLHDEAFFTVAGEICVNSKSGFISACEHMSKVAAKVLRAKGVAPIDGVTIRKHGSYPATTHAQCPAHLNKGDWGINWTEYVDLIVKEYGGVIQPHPKFVYYTTTTASYVRQGAGRMYPIVTLMPMGSRAGYDSQKAGEDIGGNNIWRHRADGLGFVHSSLLVAS